MHKRYFEKLLLKWSESRYSAIEWSLSNHEVVNRMMNHKFAEEHEMISKACENFSKNKRFINIHDDFFQKIYCLLTIDIRTDHNSEFFLSEFLKLSTLVFSSVD